MLAGCFEGNLDVSNATTIPKNDVGILDDLSGPNPDLSVEEDGIPCVSDKIFFENNTSQFLFQYCKGCHVKNGNASMTAFIMKTRADSDDSLAYNHGLFDEWAKKENPDHDNASPLRLKALNIIPHGGEKVIQEDSDNDVLLLEAINRARNPSACKEPTPAGPYLDGVVPTTPYAQLRRATMLLGSRLPTAEEITQVDENPNTIDGIYDALMSDPAFFDFLKRGWMDLLHVRGLESPDGAYDEGRFPNMSWWNGPDTPETNRNRLATLKGIRQAPVQLILHIVRNGDPFTGVLTADYTMVNPFSAKSFDVEDQVSFPDPLDENAFLPVRLKGGGNSGIPAEQTYPHSGLLSSSVFWRRHPTTPTNLNRTRTKVFFKLFLDVNILTLAPRVSGADKILGIDNPLVNFEQCSVCHIVMDPVATIFQNFNEDGIRTPFEDWVPLYDAGFSGVDLPDTRTQDAVRWLGEQASMDRRFPIAMTMNAYFILTQREVLIAPSDTSVAFFAQKRIAYEAQQKEIKRISTRFVEDNYNFKTLIKLWLASPHLNIKNLDKGITEGRAEEIDALGLGNILSPENLQRKIIAIFGKEWFDEYEGHSAIDNEVGDSLVNNANFYSLFDGINSRETTRRLKDPSGLNGAVMNLMAEEVACQNTAIDFEKAKGERLLFPFIDATEREETLVRKNMVYLFERILGQRLKPDDADITTAYTLWSDIQKDGEAGVLDGRYSSSSAVEECRNNSFGDDLYTMRSWRAIVVYLLSNYYFFYQ